MCFVNPARPAWGLGWVCLGTVCGVVPLVSAVCGVRGCTSVSACLWDVCGFVRAPLAPAVSGSSVRCGRACWARVLAVPRLSSLGCPGVFFAFFFLVLVAWCPRSGLLVPVAPSPVFRAGLLAPFFFWCVSACFWCPFSRWAAVPGLVLPVLAWWSPCATLGVLSSVPSGGGVGRLWWCWREVLVAVGCFRAPPPLTSVLFFSSGGGVFVPPSAFPGLAHVLARIQCCLAGCCWRLRSIWPCSGPMGRVGYVHVGLGAPSCRVRSWLCRLSGCARRLRVALG